MGLYRELATRVGIGEAQKGVREQGWNTGPAVQKYQRADGLVTDPDTGYPWCASFVCWCFEKAGRPLVELHESASVGMLLQAGTKEGWRVAVPARGDLICFYWGGPGDTWPDHIGIVTKTLRAGQVKTVEGNTSGDSAGSQDEGDGVFLKSRDTTKYRVAYLRVPGEETDTGPDYEIIRGQGERQRVIAVADTYPEAAQIVKRLFARGATGATIRKTPSGR